MKVIFLDIDGVLDIFELEKLLQELLEPALLRLKRIVAETGAKLWLSLIGDTGTRGISVVSSLKTNISRNAKIGNS